MVCGVGFVSNFNEDGINKAAFNFSLADTPCFSTNVWFVGLVLFVYGACLWVLFLTLMKLFGTSPSVAFISVLP